MTTSTLDQNSTFGYMQQMKQQPEETTMSSLEISELTGKQHTNVLRDIRETLQQTEIDELRFESIYKDSMNRDKVIYNLPRRECDLIISGYSVPYRLAIIDRWKELENNQPSLPNFTDPSEMARVWADQRDTSIRHLEAAEEQKQKAVAAQKELTQVLPEVRTYRATHADESLTAEANVKALLTGINVPTVADALGTV